jgi:hypothetical protein
MAQAAEHVRKSVSRLLPRGPLDLLIQLALLATAYWTWRHARGAVDGSIGLSFSHARDLVSAERSVGLVIEPSVQHWAVDAGWPAEVARWGYANLHFKGSCLMLAILYFGYRGSFGFVRNAVFCAMAISVIGYALFPTAPPRFLPELGFEDSVAQFTGVNTQTSNVLFNPFAAVPSMHVAFALMLGLSMAALVRHAWAKALWCVYPLLVTFVVVATANHWWFDGFTGAVTAAVSALVARELFARARPEVWAWNPARA